MAKTLTRWIPLLAVLGTLGGCATAGRDFKQPTPDTAAVGRTTKEQIRQTFGAPREERSDTSASPTEDTSPGSGQSTIKRTRLWYFFDDPTATPALPGVIPQRRGDFYFAGDKLVSYRYSSTFKADSTDFNEAFVANLERGKTTLREAEQMLGKSGGMGIKPDSGENIGKEHYYTYWYVEVNKTEHLIIEKRLQLFFDADNVLADFKLKTTRKPYEPKNKFIPIPIIIPYK